jgi:hypothetical protein
VKTGTGRTVAALVPALLLLVPGVILGYGYLDALSGGTPLPGIHPNSLGLGGARAIGFGDAASIFLNPADLYRLPGSSYTIAIGGAVSREVVTDSLGKTRIDNLALGNLMAAFKLQPSPQLAIGAGVARITDASYEATVYVYETEPPDIGKILADTMALSTGGLYEAAGSVAYRLSGWLNAGFSAGLRFGGADVDYEYTDREEPENDSTWTESWEDNAFCWHAGLMLPLDMTSIGISYASGSDYYDDRIAAGAVFYTDASNQGAIGIEAQLSSLGDEPDFTARITGRFSPEGSLRFRGGLFFRDSSEDAVGSEIGFAVGTSVAFGRFSLDGAFSTSTRKTEGYSFGYANIDDLKNVNSLFSIGLSYNP